MPKIDAKESGRIRLKLDHIIADRVQYKPYISQLSHENLYVEIELDEHEILEATSKATVITVAGLAAILGTVADAIEEMNEESRKVKYGH